MTSRMDVAAADLQFMIANEKRIYDTAYNALYKGIGVVVLPEIRKSFYDLCYKYSEVKMILEAYNGPDNQIKRSMVTYVSLYADLSRAYERLQQGLALYEQHLSVGINSPKDVTFGMSAFHKKMNNRINLNQYLLNALRAQMNAGFMPGPNNAPMPGSNNIPANAFPVYASPERMGVIRNNSTGPVVNPNPITPGIPPVQHFPINQESEYPSSFRRGGDL